MNDHARAPDLAAVLQQSKSQDHYERLGVKPEASAARIMSAAQMLLKVLKSDQVPVEQKPAAETARGAIIESRNILTGQETRKSFDGLRRAGGLSTEESLWRNARLPAPPRVDTASSTIPPVGNGGAVVCQGLQQGVPSVSENFQTIMELGNAKLEVKAGRTVDEKKLCDYEFQLTLKSVPAFQTQETLDALVKQLNAVFRTMNNLPSYGYSVILSGNHDLPRNETIGDVVFVCTSVIRGSRNQTTVTQLLGLQTHNLVEQSTNVVRFIAGLWRARVGFPSNEADICGFRDQGCLLQGGAVRTKVGPYSNSAMAMKSGILGWTEPCSDEARLHVGIVGGEKPRFIPED